MTALRLLLPMLVVAAACGGAGVPAEFQSPTVAPTASPLPTATPAPTAAPSSFAGSVTFSVAAGSKATVRVTEQLADRRDLSDAVLASDKVTGSFTLLPDGTFFPASSKIVVDLTALASDNRQRDQFIKMDTLQTRQFPTATFVPTRTEGAPLPLPANADMKFKLIGQMTVRGVTKEMAFDMVATRAGGDLKATATAAPFTFGTFGMTQPRVFSVLSIKDEIRLEVQLVATQTP